MAGRRKACNVIIIRSLPSNGIFGLLQTSDATPQTIIAIHNSLAFPCCTYYEANPTFSTGACNRTSIGNNNNNTNIVEVLHLMERAKKKMVHLAKFHRKKTVSFYFR